MTSEVQYDIVQECPIEPIIELYREGGWWEENEKNRQVIPGMIKGSFCFITASYRGKLVGMGRVISDGASDGYIQDLIVLREFRGMNIGKEITVRLVRYCLDRGLEWVGLIAETDTVAFYQNLGFQVLKGFKPMVYRMKED